MDSRRRLRNDTFEKLDSERHFFRKTDHVGENLFRDMDVGIRDVGTEFLAHVRVGVDPTFTVPPVDPNNGAFGLLGIGSATDLVLGTFKAVYLTTFGMRENELVWEFLWPLAELATLTGISATKWEAYVSGPRNGANTRLFAGMLQAGCSKAKCEKEENLWWELCLPGTYYALHHVDGATPPAWKFVSATACGHVNDPLLGVDPADRTKLCAAAAAMVIHNGTDNGHALKPGQNTKGCVANPSAGGPDIPTVSRGADGSYKPEELLKRWRAFIDKHHTNGGDPMLWDGEVRCLSEEKRTAGNRVLTRYYDEAQQQRTINWTLVQNMRQAAPLSRVAGWGPLRFGMSPEVGDTSLSL